jgi:carbon monoxide dehydrogenase subunit G
MCSIGCGRSSTDTQTPPAQAAAVANPGAAPASQKAPGTVAPGATPAYSAVGHRADGSPYEVAITRDNSALASYKDGGGRATNADGRLTVELNSPDDDYSVVIEVAGAKVGTVPVVAAASPGNARLTATGPTMMLGARADAGELKIDELTNTSCSGSFKAKRGTKYTFEGKFSKIPITR